MARTKHRFVPWAVGAGILILTQLPLLLGWAMTPEGYAFSGRHILAPGDFSVYYSYIEQGRTQGPMMRDVFTSESHPATIFQPLWWIVGRMAEALNIPTPDAFAITRVLAVAGLLAAVWWACTWAFQRERDRRVAVVLTMFGGGIGGLLAFFLPSLLQFTTLVPVDIWVSEAYGYLTTVASPHFALVTAGLLLIIVGTERAFTEHRRGLYHMAMASMLMVLTLHPFHLVTLMLYAMGSIAWRAWEQRHVPWTYIGHWAGVFAAGVPALLFFALQLGLDPIVATRATQNAAWTAAWWWTLAGLGFLGIAAVVSVSSAGARGTARRAFVLWAAAILVAMYLPVPFQRRLSHGLFLPIALLAAPTLLGYWDRVQSRLWRGVLLLGMIVMFGNACMFSGLHIVRSYARELAGAPSWMLYISPEHQSLIAAIRQLPTQQPILSSVLHGNIIAGLTAHPVVIGYPVETLHYAQKQRHVAEFFGSLTTAQQQEVVMAYGACYIVAGPAESSYGSAFRPAEWSELVTVWRGPTIGVYHYVPCTREHE